MLLAVLVCLWVPLGELERCNFFAPESIHSSCLVGDTLVLGTSRSCVYTLNLRTAELSRPMLVDGTRHYPNSIHNTIWSLVPLPGGRVACSYFGEIHVFDLARRATVRSTKREEDWLYLGASEKYLLGADKRSRLYGYDPTTLAQLWVIDLGRDKAAGERDADPVSAPLFDGKSNTAYVPHGYKRCAVVSLGLGAPKLERAFRGEDEQGRRGRCFLLGDHLYEITRDEGITGFVRSELRGRQTEQLTLGEVFEPPLGLVALRGGGMAGLFRERAPQRAVLRVYDAGLVQRSSADLPIKAPLAVAAGPGDLVAVTGADGVVLLTLERGRVTWSKLVRLPFPYTVPDQKEVKIVAPQPPSKR